MKTIFVMVLVCTGSPDYYSNKLNYSLESCQEDGRGTVINYYLMTGKKCAYKCVHPDFDPKELPHD